MSAPAPLQDPPRDAPAFRYRAFLSYSHRDAAIWPRLRRGLEGYRIDKDLVGRETAHGPVPKSLRPIFRDRDDFSAGHSLTEQTIAALEASQFLVVICSPNAAQSKYVNEEIRQFKALGRASRVINVVVAGEPGDPQQECFPPAVRFTVDTGGAITEEREEPIAADARQRGDGKEIAKQKIAAGLLGVGLDEILRRARRARKRRNRFRFGAAVAALLVATATVIGWRGVHLLHMQLLDTQDINDAREAADLCEKSGRLTVTEVWRIALVSECVETLGELLSDLPPATRLPQRVSSLFSANLAVMRTFAVARKLTPDQAVALNKAEASAGRLGVR